MKRIFLLIISLVCILFLCTCADGIFSWPAGGGGYDGDSESGGAGGGASPSDPGGEGGPDVNGNGPQAGQLTCGEWSDIKNYDFYLNLFNIAGESDTEESQQQTGFMQYINYFGFETRYMYTVSVTCLELPVNDATVELSDSDGALLFTAKTDMRGKAYLFPDHNLNGETITVKATSGNYEKEQTLVHEQNELEIKLDSRGGEQSILDLMFVIDTTGSMGDELNYLKAEIADVIDEISANNPGYIINLALLFYRDINDTYVTRYFDFTTNIATQQNNLSNQSANGGGDFPEAVDRALSEAVEKNWTTGNATRLIFHVCDAPPHSDQQNQTVFFNSVNKAAEKGIRIIPVASSGIDLATEFLLRQEAIMTGGTYIFLTDDSGIGNSHLQPTIGEYTVEYLNACMVRVVNEYLTGIETEPVSIY